MTSIIRFGSATKGWAELMKHVIFTKSLGIHELLKGLLIVKAWE